jgi:hypothetical protein
LIDVFLVFDSQRDREEGFFGLGKVGAASADDLVGEDSAKHILDKGRLIGCSHLILNPIEEHIGKLINIHLFCYIGRVAFVVFEGITEIFRIVEFIIAVPKMKEHLLYLIEQIFFLDFWGKRVFLAVGEGVSEARDHKELLHERVHVADAAEILDADVAGCGFHLVEEGDGPVVEPTGAPLSLPVQLSHIDAHFFQGLLVAAHQDPQKAEALVSALVGLAQTLGIREQAVRNDKGSH